MTPDTFLPYILIISVVMIFNTWILRRYLNNEDSRLTGFVLLVMMASLLLVWLKITTFEMWIFMFFGFLIGIILNRVFRDLIETKEEKREQFNKLRNEAELIIKSWEV